MILSGWTLFPFVCVRQAIADMVTEENLAEGRLYPPLSTIREVSFKIAVKVCDLSSICFRSYHGSKWLSERLEVKPGSNKLNDYVS